MQYERKRLETFLRQICDMESVVCDNLNAVGLLCELMEDANSEWDGGRAWVLYELRNYAAEIKSRWGMLVETLDDVSRQPSMIPH